MSALRMMATDNEKRSVLLICGLITGFVFIVSMITLYVQNQITKGLACGCIIPIPIMLVILSSLGVFVGSFTSYFFSNKSVKLKKQYDINVENTLDFLEDDQRIVIKSIIKKKGIIPQVMLETMTGYSRVKIHRILKKIESKKVIRIDRSQKSNVVYLTPKFQNIFCKKEKFDIKNQYVP